MSNRQSFAANLRNAKNQYNKGARGNNVALSKHVIKAHLRHYTNSKLLNLSANLRLSGKHLLHKSGPFRRYHNSSGNLVVSRSRLIDILADHIRWLSRNNFRNPY